MALCLLVRTWWWPCRYGGARCGRIDDPSGPPPVYRIVRKGDHSGGNLATVSQNPSILLTTSMKRSRSTGLVTYALAW